MSSSEHDPEPTMPSADALELAAALREGLFEIARAIREIPIAMHRIDEDRRKRPL